MGSVTRALYQAALERQVAACEQPWWHEPITAALPGRRHCHRCTPQLPDCNAGACCAGRHKAAFALSDRLAAEMCAPCRFIGRYTLLGYASLHQLWRKCIMIVILVASVACHCAEGGNHLLRHAQVCCQDHKAWPEIQESFTAAPVLMQLLVGIMAVARVFAAVSSRWTWVIKLTVFISTRATGGSPAAGSYVHDAGV